MEPTFDYIHELLNRQMALRAKIESSSIAGEITFTYGNDYYQEEVRSMGLAMIRDGLATEGEQLIMDFTKEHYPMHADNELKWIKKMMRYLQLITDTFIDNLHAEGYRWLQSNVDMPNEHALFHPIYELDPASLQAVHLGLNTLVDLAEPNQLEKLQGWAYYQSGNQHTIHL